MPQVSVILPVYNVEDYIAKSIRSVLDQTYRDFELLVIIDGSPDKSKEIAVSFKDPRIKIFEKENGGLSGARNFGLSRASGKYVYFMDPDDWIEKNLLEKNLSLILRNHLDFIVFGFYQEKLDALDQLIWSKKKSPKATSFHKKDKNLSIDSFHLDLLGYAWNKIYGRAFIEKYQIRFGENLSLVEDMLFNVSLYNRSDSIFFNKGSYYHYENRERTTLITQFRPDAFSLIKMKIKALKKFAETWEFANKEQFMVNSLLSGISYCVNNFFAFENFFSFLQRKQLVLDILADPFVRKILDSSSFIPQNERDRLILEYIEKESVQDLIETVLGRQVHEKDRSKVPVEVGNEFRSGSQKFYFSGN